MSLKVLDLICTYVCAGVTRVPALQSVVHQAGAGTPGSSGSRVHAQPQCCAQGPHLQQPAGH